MNRADHGKDENCDDNSGTSKIRCTGPPINLPAENGFHFRFSACLAKVSNKECGARCIVGALLAEAAQAAAAVAHRRCISRT